MIIGLAGAKRAGKNTVADFIAKNFDNVEEKSFAYLLKKSACAALGVQTNDPVGFCDDLKETGEIEVWMDDPEEGLYCRQEFSGREFLQWYGTEAHRDIFGEDFWVDAVMNNVLNKDRRGLAWEEWITVITDVRFPNEAIAIQDANGFVFEILRPSLGESTDSHASEKPLPRELLDLQIVNSGSLEQLEEMTIAAVNSHINK